MEKTFMNKQRRDQVFATIPKEERYKYRKTSIRGQLLHPMYVDDYEQETGVKLSSEDKGFGNSIYRTYFAVLYEIQERLYQAPDETVQIGRNATVQQRRAQLKR